MADSNTDNKIIKLAQFYAHWVSECQPQALLLIFFIEAASSVASMVAMSLQLQLAHEDRCLREEHLHDNKMIPYIVWYQCHSYCPSPNMKDHWS